MNFNNLRTFVVSLLGCAITSVSSTGCDGRTEDVRFQLGQKKVVVDTTRHSWTTTTTWPVTVFGEDSLGIFLIMVDGGETVTMTAGEKPLKGPFAFMVDNGKGDIVIGSYASRCSEISQGDCLEKYVDPGHHAKIKGYIRFMPVSEGSK